MVQVMPSFQDGALIFFIALLLFGPKKLPELARYVGKLMGEFRRASSEFRLQMEDEFRLSEQAEQQKKIAAMEAAAPVTPPIPEPEHPHMPPQALEAETATTENSILPPVATAEPEPPTPATPAYEIVDGVRTPVIPIASSGDLHLMPPSTGLPAQRGRSALGGLIEAIPETNSTETVAHGD